MRLQDLKRDDEEGRARALERLEILDSPDERPFENIASLVEQVLSVPMCAISLVDRERQWFKAKRGVDDKQTARNISFCTHTIQEAKPFLIPDASADPRFANSPLVIDGPRIASYAGIPLRTPDGYNIGALCAMDVRPREFSPPEVEILQSFAKMVVSEIELRDIADTDLLTGATTRRAWIEAARKEIDRRGRYGHPLSLIMLDIDKFKSVNDTHGHSIGDQVLVTLANTCGQTLRKQDLFGRYGGEEFVILLPETDLDGAITIAERCRAAFERAPTATGSESSIRCTFSGGVAEVEDGETLEDVFERADEALYQAKRSGRNRIAVANSGDSALPAVANG